MKATMTVVLRDLAHNSRLSAARMARLQEGVSLAFPAEGSTGTGWLDRPGR
jgi:hypothetical protein